MILLLFQSGNGLQRLLLFLRQTGDKRLKILLRLPAAKLFTEI